MTGRNKNKKKCGVCNNIESASNNNIDDWLYCNCCRKWYHALCCSISSKAEFDICSKKKNWFCPECIKQSNFSHIVSQAISTVIQQKDQIDLTQNQPSQSMMMSSTNDTYKSINELVEKHMQQLWPRFFDESVSKIRTEYETRTAVLTQKINKLEYQFDKHGSYYSRINRAKNLIVHGLPEGDDLQFISKLAEEFGVEDFSTNLIDYIHRFKTRSNKKSTPSTMLVRFSTLISRNKFQNAYFKYINKHQSVSLRIINDNFPDGKVYINEHLDTPTYKLFMKARNLVKDDIIKKASIVRGIVTVCTHQMAEPYIIHSEDDLRKLHSSNEQKHPSNLQNESTLNQLESHTVICSTPSKDACPVQENLSIFSQSIGQTSSEYHTLDEAK